MTEQPLLSIVITSYTMERLKDTFELLDSIKGQTYDNIEVIFVAERSPELYEKVREYGEEIFGDSIETNRDSVENGSRNVHKSQPISKSFHFKILFNDGEPGLSEARNLGIKHAKGDIIGFVDDDVVLFPDWAEEMVKTYQDDSIIGVTGPAFPLWEGKSADWFPKEFDWIIGCSSWCNWHEMREVRNVWGMNMSFKREAFDCSGLFLTHLGAKGGDKSGKHELVGEETEFSIRVRRKTGKSIFYNPNARVRHRVYKYRVAPMVIARRAYWEGYTKAMFNRIYQDKNSGEKVLNVEYQLLQRILTKLFPNILKGLFKNPVIAWRKLSVTLVALLSVAVGYFYYSFQSLLGLRKATAYEKEEA